MNNKVDEISSDKISNEIDFFEKINQLKTNQE